MVWAELFAAAAAVEASDEAQMICKHPPTRARVRTVRRSVTSELVRHMAQRMPSSSIFDRNGVLLHGTHSRPGTGGHASQNAEAPRR